MFTALLRMMRHVSHVAAWLGGFGLIAVAFLVTVEVVLRKGFQIGLSVATEYSSYVLAISTAWAYAFALLERNHVRVDALVRALPRRVVAWIDLLALLALTWLAAMLSWHGSTVAQMSYERGALAMTPMATPLWIPQGLWTLGLVVFFITCLVLLGRVVTLLAAGRTEETSGLIGTFSTKDEAEIEIRDAELRRSRQAGDDS